MTYHLSRSRFEALTTYCVSAGNSPPSWPKIFTNTGTRKSSIPIRTSVAKTSTTVG